MNPKWTLTPAAAAEIIRKFNEEHPRIDSVIDGQTIAALRVQIVEVIPPQLYSPKFRGKVPGAVKLRFAFCDPAGLTVLTLGDKYPDFQISEGCSLTLMNLQSALKLTVSKSQ